MSINQRFVTELEGSIQRLKDEKVYKRLNYLNSAQSAYGRDGGTGRGIARILSSNNYLGLSDEPSVVQAGIDGLNQFGAGTASVRFICGTFTVHRELEAAIAKLVGTPASLTYVSAWNANEGFTASVVEEGRFRKRCPDALNHASIIDSVRLAKAITKCTTAVYKHSDMDDLRAKLDGAKSARRRIIWTDGVFSMEGSIAKLPDILQLARDYDAIVVMDDSHATGVLGKTGRGTAEHFGVLGEVGCHYLNMPLGKALGGAAGGFVAGSAALCDMLTQRSRPQLFSNALPPTVASSALASVNFVMDHPERVQTLRENTEYFRGAIIEAGFKPLPGETPIVPIIVGETSAAIRMSDMLLDQGVFVTGFRISGRSAGEARVRCQISAAHTRDDLDRAVAAFKSVGKQLGD